MTYQPRFVAPLNSLSIS